MTLPAHVPVRFRAPRPEDAPAVAALHADSWQRHYRGACADTFLDAEAPSYCASMWAGRLGQPRPEARTILAERDGELAGFAHTFLDEDPVWGAFLDNLHVVSGLKRQGIGRELITRTLRAVRSHSPSSGLYLWVLEQNTAARAFYEAQGGASVERGVVAPIDGDPGRLNGQPPRLRYAWPGQS
jgi:ribosomal protein S18 acetylase RimI-like enzyme